MYLFILTLAVKSIRRQTHSAKRTETTMTTTETATATNTNEERGQTNPQVMGAEQVPQPPETKKRQYGHIEICGGCGQHGKVYLPTLIVGGGEYSVEEEILNFSDIERVCQMLDEESSQKFRNDIIQFQAEGRLQDLNSPEAKAEQEEEERLWVEARRVAEQADREIIYRLEALKEQSAKLAIAGLSHHSLADMVVSCMMEGLEDPALNLVFSEMSKRKMLISICVVQFEDQKELIELVVDPENLICQNTREKEADLETQMNDLANKMRSFR